MSAPTTPAWDGRPANPERVWIGQNWDGKTGVEYVRADMIAARVAAAVLAEREACAAVCGEVAKERWAAEEKRPVGEPLFLWLGGPDSECERRIQRRPALSGADALAAMLAQARREGIEAALVVCRTGAMAMANDHSADGPAAHSAVRLVEREIRALMPEGGKGDAR